jgi:hypothetical protein
MQGDCLTLILFEGPRSSQDTLKDDYGLPPEPAIFEVDTQGVDPSFDWAMGRRGIEFPRMGKICGLFMERAQLEQDPTEARNSKYGRTRWVYTRAQQVLPMALTYH